MQVFDTIDSFRRDLDAGRAGGAVVGFVPTMGYLHSGHITLVQRAVAECDLVAVSIFVNPLQFAANEDLASYPRDLDRDLELVAGAGATHVFAPPVHEMYPTEVLTTVRVADLSDPMEGAARPTHFAGVATVVAKLFSIVGPSRAYFGEKDFQQLAVVRRMAADLSMPVDVVGCATVREADGLAMSSRNVYLDDHQRQAALVIHRALLAGQAAIVDGERSGDEVRRLMATIIGAELSATIDYVEVADPDTLAPLNELLAGQHVRLLAAAQVGRPRLLDNVGVTVPQTP
jgi:pantoate--beta-alanine ligase